MALAPMQFDKGTNAVYPTISCTSNNGTATACTVSTAEHVTQIKFNITATSNVAVGADVTCSISNLSPVPIDTALLSGYSGNTALVGRLFTNGTISLRVVGDTFLNNYTATIVGTYATV